MKSCRQSSGERTLTVSHTYATAGIYTIALTVKDNKGGYVAGSGTIASPSGAYVANSSKTGPATFGFTSKYSTGSDKKTSTTHVGTTAFQFKLSNLDFRSTKYDWMVVSGPKVIYKGTGTINKKGTYMFMLSAIDGQIQGGNGIDTFRIKIIDKTSGKLVYDNLIGAGDDANPTRCLPAGPSPSPNLKYTLFFVLKDRIHRIKRKKYIIVSLRSEPEDKYRLKIIIYS